MSGVPFSVSIHAHEVEHDNGHFPAVLAVAARAVFCNAAAMDRLLDRLDPSLRAKCHLVYHGVDLEAFPYSPMPDFDGILRVVSAGRMTPTKGFDLAIRAVARARRQGLQLRLTLLGDGSERDRLQELVRAERVADIVEFTGWQPHEAVVARIAEAHCAVLLASTDFHDGLPNVILEALSIGRPVVVSPFPAAREAVDENLNGHILTHRDDEDELLKFWRILASDAQLRIGMSRAARASVESRHDRHRQIRLLADILSGQATRAWER
jgi:glycosyltransferase involved in cell wall biosynthesis